MWGHVAVGLSEFLCDYFDSNILKDDCYVSDSAHLEPDGYAVKGDVVLLKAAETDHGPWAASQVWLHVEIGGMAPYLWSVCTTLFVMTSTLTLLPGPSKLRLCLCTLVIFLRAHYTESQQDRLLR